MIILGVDPGILHTGVCVIKTGKPVYHSTIVPMQSRAPFHTYIPHILSELQLILNEYSVTVAAVEAVSWYGKGRRIILPLSHIAGAITGMLLTNELPVYFLTPNMKKAVKMKGFNSSWDEHQKDAALLAKIAENAELVFRAGGNSALRKPSAASARRITIPPPVPSSRSVKEKAGKK